MPKLFIETYGCQMNVADTEVVAAIMQMHGYTVTDTVDDADAVLLNTCSIRDNAEQKIFGRLAQLRAMRRRPAPTDHRRHRLHGRAHCRHAGA